MALILLGAACQESDKQQAAVYLKLALKVADDPTIAIQGLANCAENVELPDIYEKLLKLTPYEVIKAEQLKPLTNFINFLVTNIESYIKN